MLIANKVNKGVGVHIIVLDAICKDTCSLLGTIEKSNNKEKNWYIERVFVFRLYKVIELLAG